MVQNPEADVDPAKSERFLRDQQHRRTAWDRYCNPPICSIIPTCSLPSITPEFLPRHAGLLTKHRILVSRLFFWLDLSFFHGLSLLLIPLNLTLMGLLCLALLFGTRNLAKANYNKEFIIAATSWLVLICFSWMQKENITGHFRANFFVAYLFPLLAFQSVALSSSGSRSRSQFACALFFGSLSLGTMANGILALPLMLLMASMLSQSRVRILILIITTLVGVIITYHGSGTFGSISSALMANPRGMLEFFLVSLGGPFRVISNDFLVAGIAGAIFVAGCVQCAWIWYRREERSPMFLAFVIFLFYVVASALATTSGRARID